VGTPPGKSMTCSAMTGVERHRSAARVRSMMGLRWFRG
jgi:hypothetical protein